MRSEVELEFEEGGRETDMVISRSIPETLPVFCYGVGKVPVTPKSLKSINT